MQTLCLNEGDIIKIKLTDLPRGKFAKVQAQSTDFLDITDTRAVYVFPLVILFILNDIVHALALMTIDQSI